MRYTPMWKTQNGTRCCLLLELHAWQPYVLVADKYAVGTSRAMHLYLRAWDTLSGILSQVENASSESVSAVHSAEHLLPLASPGHCP